MKQRPTGVAVLAVAAAVLGVLAILAAGAWWNASEGIAWLPRIHGSEKLVALVLLAVGLCELVLAYGAWTLRPWAWTFGVVLQIAVIVLAALQLGRLEAAAKQLKQAVSRRTTVSGIPDTGRV